MVLKNEAQQNWKDELANYMGQHFGGEAEEPQYMKDGGVAGELQGPPYMPPMLPPQPDTGFNPAIGLPAAAPVAAAPAVTSVASKPEVSQTLPPEDEGPDSLQEYQAYLAQQKEDLNKYGPEEQMALEQSIQKQRTGFLPNLALAGAGFADDIMQGVAQAGPGTSQANLRNQMDKTQEGQRSALKNAQSGHLAKMKQEMELAQMDPASPLSRSVQRANAKTLTALGYSPEDAAIIPAAWMPDVLAKRLTLEEIHGRNDLLQATLANTAAYQGLTLGAAARKEKADAAEKAADRQYQAAKDVKAEDKTTKAHIFSTDVPVWPSPVSRKQRREAGQIIRGRMSGTPTMPAMPMASEAEAWARANPNDPKSAAILQRLGK